MSDPVPIEPPASLCADTVCITCSDVAVPVRIDAVLDDGLAIVSTMDGAEETSTEEISIALVEARPGDVVLVHAKEAIAVVEQAP